MSGQAELSVALHAATFVLFLCAAWLARRRSDSKRPGTAYLLYAALLGAIAEACLIPGWNLGSGTPLSLLGHIFGDLALAALFVAVYGKAVRFPHAELKQAHTTARLDKEWLDAILRSTADGVLIVDAQLQVQFANPVACQLIGRTASEASGMPLREMLAAFDASGDVFLADVETCLREGRARADIHHASTSGGHMSDDLRAIEYSVAPVVGPESGIAGAVLALRDVTGRWQIQQQLLAAADYARNLLESSPDPMIAVGPEGIITDLNRATEIATGMAREQLVGAYFVSCFTDSTGARIALQRALAGETVRNLDLVLTRTGGGLLQVRCNIAPQRNTGGIGGAIAVVRDVTDLRQVELQLQFQADCDALTALPNRRQFRERVDQAIALAAADSGGDIAVMVVDLDDFNDINDTQGHATGDELLKKIARRLAEVLRDAGTLARIGGDKFGVLLAANARKPDIQAVVERILAAVAAPLRLDEHELIVGCSIGVSIHSRDLGDADALLRNANAAMYSAKENGKNQCQIFLPEMNAAIQRRGDLVHHLRGALARGELSLHYQPQVDLRDGVVVGVEALLRWHNAELGFVPPAEFIPIAEDTGLILPIGAWVLAEACRQAARWHAESGADLGVAVNLSACQFRDEGLVAQVTEALAASGLPPRLLELELTEGMLMRDAAHATETMRQLRATGASLSIDDFGTGYSSLAYLKRFPLDKLKIDRSFVMDIPGDTNDIAIVRSILALAHGLGLAVIAEGAETDAQIAFLRNYGCEVVQGYYISRPLPAANIPAFLARWGEEQKPALAGRQSIEVET